jgi:hypothetical protein
MLQSWIRNLFHSWDTTSIFFFTHAYCSIKYKKKSCLTHEINIISIDKALNTLQLWWSNNYMYVHFFYFIPLLGTLTSCNLVKCILWRRDKLPTCIILPCVLFCAKIKALDEGPISTNANAWCIIHRWDQESNRVLPVSKNTQIIFLNYPGVAQTTK